MSVLKKYSKYKKEIRGGLFLFGLLFVLALAKESWGEISGLVGQINAGEFIFSIIVGVVGNITMAVLFNRLLGKYGVKITDYLAIKMYLVGQIAKYIPGKIWAVAYQVSHVAGVSGARGVVLANIELTLGAMFMTTVLSVVLMVFLESKLIAAILILLGMAGFVFIYKTNIVKKFIRFLPSKLKQNVLLSEIEYEPTRIVSGVVFYLIFCFGYVVSYLLMLDAVFGFSFEESFVYIALLSAAWLVGVFAFFVPAGMGVREVLFVAASSYVVPEHSVEILISIAVLSRFWQIIQEIVGVSLLLFLRRQ